MQKDNKITKEDALSIIIESSKLYNKHLCNKNVLFLYKEKTTEKAVIIFKAMETEFTSTQFLHLTGVKIINNKGKKEAASSFYKKCINNKLKITDFELHKEPIYYKKFSIIKSLMEIEKGARMLGIYNNNMVNLKTNLLAGGISSCMGFVKGNNMYYPNTILAEDIRSQVNYSNQIIAIFVKPKKDKDYKICTYKSKKYDINSIIKNIDFGNKNIIVQL